MTFETMEHNLRQLYIAAHQDVELTTDFSGKHLYIASHGWGRFWSWIHSLRHFFFSEYSINDRVASVIRQTHEVFCANLPNIVAANALYRDYLEIRAEGVPIDEGEVHEARRTIIYWNIATGPFTALFETEEMERLQRIFAAYSPLEPLFLLANEEFEQIKASHATQQLINLEGVLHQPLPIQLFDQLFKEESFAEKEQKLFSRWVKAYNENDALLPVGDFFKALQAYCKIQGVDSEAAHEMCFRFFNHGLRQVFLQEDPALIDWRETLGPGSVLKVDGKIFTISEKIGSVGKEEQTWIFSVEDAPHLAVVVDVNPIIYRLRRRNHEDKAYFLPQPELHHTSEDGYFSVVEHLGETLENRPWEERENGNVAAADYDLLEPIVNMVKEMLGRKISPQTLDPKSLGYSESGVLHSMTPFYCNDFFSYVDVEKFLVELSNYRPRVLKLLLSRTTLKTHPSRGILLDVIKAAIDNKKLYLDDAIALAEIDDPSLKEHGKALYKEVLRVKTECFYVVFREYALKGMNVEALKQAIAEKILEMYEASRVKAVLSPNLQEEVVEAIAKDLQLVKRASLR